MNKIAPYWKALVAFIAPGAALMIADSTTGSISGTDLLVALATCIVSAGAVYAAPKNASTTPRRYRNEDGRVRPLLALGLALVMAIAGALLTFASPAHALGWSGQRCDNQAANSAAKVCLNIHTIPSGNGMRVDQVQLCAYKMPQTYYNGFQGTKSNQITFQGSSGAYLGFMTPADTGASVGGVCNFTNAQIQMGMGACFLAYGTLNLAGSGDGQWSLAGKVLGGAC
jgi:hypothetical protein